MRRRHVVSLIGAALVVPAALAQAHPRRIGFLGARPDALVQDLPVELRRLGYRESVTIAAAYSTGGVAELRLAARKLMDSKPEVIVAATSSALLAARMEALEIPIVGASITDPQGLGLVDAQWRPLGNVTGVSNRGEDTTVKRVAFMREITPIRRLAYFFNGVSEGNKRALETSRPSIAGMGIEVHELDVRGAEQIETALEKAAAGRVDSMLVPLDPLFTEQRARFIRFAMETRLPSMGSLRQFVESGGLLSYGSDQHELVRITASYVARLLEGARVRDLPLQQSDKLELCLNRRTARALSLEVPGGLLALANFVVD